MAEEKATKSLEDDKILAAVATLPLVGLVIYFAMPDASPYVKHYAKQGGIGLLPLWAVAMVIIIIPFLGAILSCVIGIVAMVAWILLLIHALQGDAKFKLPVLGDLVDQIVK